MSNDCDRLRGLYIPENNENICWWLSVNLALFHKKRPEFEAIKNVFNATGINNIKAPATKEGIFMKIYNYYSGNDIMNDTERDTFMEYLQNGARNALKGLVKLPGFTIEGTDYKDTTEYFAYLSKALESDDKLNDLYIQCINETPGFLGEQYDIYYHATYFGLPRDMDNNKISEGSTLSGFYEFPQPPISSNRHTLVLGFGRKKSETEYNDYEIIPLKTMTIPTCKKDIEIDTYRVPIKGDKETTLNEFIKELLSYTETSTFELDAITVSTPGGGHFVTYIKCGDGWLYDNGMSEGSLATKQGHEEFESYEDMMTKKGDTIRKNLVMLYYSKVVTETA